MNIGDYYKGEKYQYIGAMSSPRFLRGSTVYDLREMTDQDVELLIGTEPEYWNTHFREAEKAEAPALKRRRRAKEHEAKEEEE